MNDMECDADGWLSVALPFNLQGDGAKFYSHFHDNVCCGNGQGLFSSGAYSFQLSLQNVQGCGYVCENVGYHPDKNITYLFLSLPVDIVLNHLLVFHIEITTVTWTYTGKIPMSTAILIAGPAGELSITTQEPFLEPLPAHGTAGF